MLSYATSHPKIKSRIHKLALIFVAAFAVAFFAACGDNPTPRPRAFPRVVYPASGYKTFDTTFCNFTFEQPIAAVVEQDTAFFGEKPDNACWFTLKYPAWGGSVHISYKPIHSRADFDKCVSDANSLTNKHTVKADYIDPIDVRSRYGVSGVVFNVEGNVASFFQFYLSDTTHHFVRGAMYFNTHSRPDSLAPVINYVKRDIMHAIETFRWKK